mmetsp:Transcript_39439/g.111829  ORF Transcript_39439/g.111829 Transcript_39439/m.111829 type:complete len:206 (+) Transcript_39439:1248-1865(+)
MTAATTGMVPYLSRDFSDGKPLLSPVPPSLLSRSFSMLESSQPCRKADSTTTIVMETSNRIGRSVPQVQRDRRRPANPPGSFFLPPSLKGRADAHVDGSLRVSHRAPTMVPGLMSPSTRTRSSICEVCSDCELISSSLLGSLSNKGSSPIQWRPTDAAKGRQQSMGWAEDTAPSAARTGGRPFCSSAALHHTLPLPMAGWRVRRS